MTSFKVSSAPNNSDWGGGKTEKTAKRKDSEKSNVSNNENCSFVALSAHVQPTLHAVCSRYMSVVWVMSILRYYNDVIRECGTRTTSAMCAHRSVRV